MNSASRELLGRVELGVGGGFRYIGNIGMLACWYVGMLLVGMLVCWHVGMLAIQNQW